MRADKRLPSQAAKARLIKEDAAPVFRKAFIRWLSTISPEEHDRILESAEISAVSEPAKKALFLEVYKHLWPNRVEALTACGLSTYWLQTGLKKDPEFAAGVLEINLARVDKLKGYSYEQCFKQQNTVERIFWLKKIDSEEFGDDPLINMTNIINTSVGREGFAKVEEMLKRRDELLKMKKTPRELESRESTLQPLEDTT